MVLRPVALPLTLPYLLYASLAPGGLLFHGGDAEVESGQMHPSEAPAGYASGAGRTYGDVG